jgi:adenosylcobinamide-phosphate synthase
MSFDAPNHLILLLAALALDAALGDPDWLWRRLPHPVALAGRGIAWLDEAMNLDEATPEMRRRAGRLTLVAVVTTAGVLGLLLGRVFAALPLGWLGEVVVVAVLLAQRSLYLHAGAVAQAFAEGGLAAARVAVAQIVGRDPESLDEAGVCRAALESLAENFSDGVVAPALWYLLLGLPGLLIYKVVNTADSMIGHKTPRHLEFGRATARFDDLLNLPAARLSALLLGLAAGPGRALAALRAAGRDASRHRSPNAGWPEAALAAALGLALAGPRRYGESEVEDAWMNAEGRREAGPADIDRGLELYLRACGLLWGLVALVALIFA